MAQISSSENTTEQPAPKPLGFRVMNPKLHREIAAMGGRAAHEKGRAHEFTSEEAQKAGRKGGATVSANREHMARIGRLGGYARRASPSDPKGQRQRRKRLGVSIATLAKRSGVSRGTISRFEAGQPVGRALAECVMAAMDQIAARRAGRAKVETRP